MWKPGLCGSWLACDGIDSVSLEHRVDAIAGKPGSHTSQLPHLTFSTLEIRAEID